MLGNCGFFRWTEPYSHRQDRLIVRQDVEGITLARVLRIFGVSLLGMVVMLMANLTTLVTTSGGSSQPSIAEASPLNVDGPLVSGFQVQNLDTTGPATVYIRYVRTNGAEECWPSAADCQTTIEAGRSKTFLPGAPKTATTWPLAVPEGFNGSAVVESDRQVAVISNTQATSGNLWGSYSGVSSPSRVVSLPLIAKRNSGWSTTLYVQNAGTADTSFTISFRGKVRTTGAPQNVDIPAGPIKKGAMYELDQSTMSQLSDGWVGSVRVTAAGAGDKIAATVNYSNGAQLLGYTGFNADAGSTDIGQTLHAPLVQNGNGGWWSGIQVMNVGGSAARARLVVNGATVASTPVLQPNESHTWLVSGAGSPWSSLPKYFSASVQGDGGSSWVGIVNQTHDSNPSGGMAYRMSAQGSRRVVVPLLMNANSGWWTGLQVQNVGASTVTGIQVKLDGNLVKSDLSLAPGASATFLAVNPLAGGFVNRGGNVFVSTNGARWVGSAEIVGPAGSKLVAIVNETNNTASGENAMTYEAFNLP